MRTIEIFSLKKSSANHLLMYELLGFIRPGFAFTIHKGIATSFLEKIRVFKNRRRSNKAASSQEGKNGYLDN